MAGAARFVIAAAPHGATTVTTPIAHAIAGGRDSYADIVEVVSPAVVTIRTEGKAAMSSTQFQLPDNDFFRQFFGDRFGENGAPRGRQPRTFKQHALGSGVIVTTDGYIMTNHHVVDGAEAITVETTDGRTLHAKVVGSDKASDLALLKVDGHFTPVAFGNSDTVKVGDVVLAVGNPLGVGQTVTMGIISAKSRSTGVGNGTYEDFLQTDAPINHGNSGGALVNTKGELVGINSQILSNSDGNIGIGFAIPANMTRSVMDQLRTTGKVIRSQLGVTIQPVTPDMAESLNLHDSAGLIISNVRPDSAGARAGLKQGDVILTFNDQPVHDANTLRNRVAAMRPGTEATVTIVRDGIKKTMTVKLEALDAERIARNSDNVEGDTNDKSALGVTVGPSQNGNGVIVQDVDPNGRAADAGIRPGDVIESVNRRAVRTTDELRSALKQMNDKPALLLIQRDGNDLFVTVRPANG
jgi:Do/DeqQ family serine protease